MVIGMHSSGGDMVVVGVVRTCCAVDVSGGVFGCTSYPCRIVACAWDARVGSFT